MWLLLSLLPCLSLVSPQGCNVMEDQDLRDIGIGDPQHRRKLLQAARSLPKVSTSPGWGNKSQTLHLQPWRNLWGCGKGLGNGREEEEEYTGLPGCVDGGSSILGLLLLPVLIPSTFFICTVLLLLASGDGDGCKLIFIDPISLGIAAPAAFNTFLVFSQLKPLGCDGNSQPSVPAWLDSLGLQDYIQSFLSSGYSSIDTVKNLWELEIVNVSVTPLLPGQQGPVPWSWDLLQVSQSSCVPVVTVISPCRY